MATKSKKTKAAQAVETPAAEVAESKAEPKTRGPRGVPETAVIHLLVTANPKREGSKSFERFNGYADGQTIAQALDAGVTTPDLVWDAKHGFISIEGYDPGELIQPKPKAAPKPKAEKKAKAAKVEKTAEEMAADAAADAAAVEESMA